MDEALELLAGNVFHMATLGEDGRAHVRPIGSVEVIEGRPYICTNNTKAMFKEIMADPRIEISADLGNGEWLRIRGILVHDPRREAKVAMLEAVPSLSSMYNIDDGIFEVLYLKDCHVTHYKGFMVPFKEFSF